MNHPSTYWNDLGALQTKFKLVVEQRDALLAAVETILALGARRHFKSVELNWTIVDVLSKAVAKAKEGR